MWLILGWFTWQDIIFVLKQKPHSRFTTDMMDLIYTARITLKQALCGCKINILTLDGKTLDVTLPDMASTGHDKVCVSVLILVFDAY